jgi:glycosyltransferase involved in cell wall biosynthesis
VSDLLVSIVIIGRNEGDRLVRCIESVKAMNFPTDQYEILYIDSGSTDDSMKTAEGLGAKALEIEPPTTAAKGRNKGIQESQAPFLLFLDGDTILDPDFLQKAMDYIQAHDDVAVVWGHRREIRPEDSIYNRILDLDWIYPPGDTPFCGGDAVMRKTALEKSGPFREDLIAGEEPELCNRITKAGFRIYHMDVFMTGHDLAIRKFSAYWKRCYRAGHAYAEVADLTGGRQFGRDGWRNHIQSVGYMVLPILLPLVLGWIGLLILLLGASVLVARTYVRQRWRGGSAYTTLLFAIHSHFAQPIIWLGQMKYYRNRRSNRAGRIIEYK